MTNCIVIGEEPKEDLKPIEFKKYLDRIGDSYSSDASLRDYENIERISNGYAGGSFDLMYAYDDKRSSGVLYLGHWNSGTV